MFFERFYQFRFILRDICGEWNKHNIMRVYTLIYIHTTISFTGRLHCSRVGKKYVLCYISVLHNIIEPRTIWIFNYKYIICIRTNYNNVYARGLSLRDKCRNRNANCTELHCDFFHRYLLLIFTHTAPFTREYVL